MKTEELLRRQAAEISARVDHLPWLLPEHNRVEIVTPVEGLIREDGSGVQHKGERLDLAPCQV